MKFFDGVIGLLILGLILALPACAMVEKIRESAERVEAAVVAGKEVYEDAKPVLDDLKGKVGQIPAVVAEVKQVHEDAKKEADEDGDGKLDWKELFNYLLAGGLGLSELARRRMGKQLVGRVEHERRKRKAIEAAIPEAAAASREA